jgi:hypothetical protein
MTKTYKLASLNQGLRIATTLSKSWFRGHSKMISSLTPKIFRHEYRTAFHKMFDRDVELPTILAFKRHASLLTELRLPADDDHLGWLSVMQHYKAPTRLLDWTENLLVALYFAVSADMNEDGELWALLPWALNEAAGAGWGIPLASSRHLKFLLDQAFWDGSPEALAQTLKLPRPVTSPLALEPPLRFPRMAVQASTFTIHPDPKHGGTIQNVLPDPKHLIRYRIPSGAKQALRRQLRILGFSDVRLFPDLEGLSRTIAFDNKGLAYSPPEPPVCAGEDT